MFVLAVPSVAGEPEDLGIAVRAVCFGNSQACLATSPGGHARMFYIPYYATSGGALVGIDPDSGEHVKIPIASQGGYGTAVGQDGAIYVGGVNPGDLYRFEPGSGKVENLGGSQFGSSYIWACDASADGSQIFAACYPTAGVLAYDVASRSLRDLGRMSQSEQYARSIAVGAQGKVWVGIGTHADLVVWDPLSGVHRSVLPPSDVHNSIAYNVAAAGTHMLVSLLYDHKHLLYDARSETPVAVFGQPADGLTYMAARSDNPRRFYLYSAPGGSLYSYEPGAAQPTLLVENLGQVALVREDRYAYVIDDQDFVYYDLVGRQPIFQRKLVEAVDGMDVFAMTAGADGTIYGSTYINMHMFSVDQPDGRIRDLGKALRWGGQIDSMHGGRDGKVYLGSYVHAVVSVYDPSRPWQPGPRTDANPREYGPIGSGQYRTTSIALGPDDRIYVGSIPSYDSAPTGAFSRVDPRTGEIRTWLDVTPGGTIQHIVVDDQYVYGAGGGRFLAWDPQAERAVVSLDLPTTAMVLAPGGEVVGCGGGRCYVFSPAKREVIRTLENPLGDFTHLCRSPDGNLYGIHDGRIGRITPGSWTIDEVAGEGGKFLAADAAGRLYFARGSHVLRFVPPQAADRQ